MRYRFHTLSAARYVIDTEGMTWKRSAPDPRTPPKVFGLEETEGELHSIPSIRIGERARIQIGRGMYDFISTTPVQRIELLDE